MANVVACWHHGSEYRLKECLAKGYCDLHPLAAECPKGRMSAERWYHGKMKLKKGDWVRFCVEKRKIVAIGKIASEPYKCAQPIDASWPSAVDITSVMWENGGYCASPPRLGSHRLEIK